MKVNNMFDNRPMRIFSSLRSSQIREHTFKCVTVVAAGGFSPGLWCNDSVFFISTVSLEGFSLFVCSSRPAGREERLFQMFFFLCLWLYVLGDSEQHFWENNWLCWDGCRNFVFRYHSDLNWTKTKEKQTVQRSIKMTWSECNSTASWQTATELLCS